jgi:hypothetical protein
VTAFAAPRAIVRISAAAAVALTLAGCVTSGVSDLTGAVASYNPLAGPSAEPRVVPLLVASTYGQGGAGPAKFSEIVATVPPGHSPGFIERPVLTPESARRHVTLKSRRPLAASAFQSEVSRQLAGRQGLGRDVLVYVHGYNTGFDEAAYRVTQIVADTGFSGAAVLFAWPSTRKAPPPRAMRWRNCCATSAPIPTSAACMCSPIRWEPGLRWSRFARPASPATVRLAARSAR